MSDPVSRLKAVLVLGFGLAASACGGGSGDALNGGDGTAVAELVLEVSIGEDFEADPQYQFALIRSILITSDRTIWVADITGRRGTPMLRQYDAGGTFLRQVARDGDGPWGVSRARRTRVFARRSGCRA